MTGHWRDEQLYALEQALSHYDFLEHQIQDNNRRILQVLSKLSLSADVKVPAASKQFMGGHRTAPQREALRVALYRVLGVDLTAIPTIGLDTALTIASKVGSDLSRFPDNQHFCSWTTLAPGTRISGGKPLPGRTPRPTYYKSRRPVTPHCGHSRPQQQLLHWHRPPSTVGENGEG